MEITSEARIGRRFLTDTLRNTDHYTAIADIIDNSLESKVGSKNVRVYITKTGMSKYGCLASIEVADDGCGMDLATLQEALVLGSNTGKSLEDDYGYYGAGLKTAGFSIGRRLTVVTKMQKDGIYKGVFDLDSNPEGALPVTVFTRVEEGSEDAVNFYGKIKGEHGTLVTIDKIDRGLQNVDQFRTALKNKIRVIFNKFIENGDVSFYLYSDKKSEKLEFFDTVGVKAGLSTIVVADESFRMKGANVRVRVLNVPYDGTSQHNNQHNSKNEDFFPRTVKASGFYIYRKNRLVGGLNQGLDLGMIQKSSGRTTGIRVELYVDGKADILLGCTFNKMISERDRDGIDKDLYGKIYDIVSPIVNAEIRRARKSENEKVLTEREKLILKAFDVATTALNKNDDLRAGLIQKGRNQHPGTSKPKNPNPKKQLHPCLHRNRTGNWTNGFRTVNEGSESNHVSFSLHDKRIETMFNADHGYFRHLSALPVEAIVDECLQIGGMAAALQKVGYFDDEDKRQVIDEFLTANSQALGSLYDSSEVDE